MMPVFSKQNPQLVIEERLHSGHHPWFKAEYSTRLEFCSKMEGLAALRPCTALCSALLGPAGWS